MKTKDNEEENMSTLDDNEEGKEKRKMKKKIKEYDADKEREEIKVCEKNEIWDKSTS